MSAPKTMPKRSGSTAPLSNNACVQAKSAAANANWMSRLITLRLLRGRTCVFGSKSATSAPNGAGRSLPLKRSKRRTPLRPSRSDAQKARLPTPIGLTTPTPVITISRALAIVLQPPFVFPEKNRRGRRRRSVRLPGPLVSAATATAARRDGGPLGLLPRASMLAEMITPTASCQVGIPRWTSDDSSVNDSSSESSDSSSASSDSSSLSADLGSTGRAPARGLGGSASAWSADFARPGRRRRRRFDRSSVASFSSAFGSSTTAGAGSNSARAPAHSSWKTSTASGSVRISDSSSAASPGVITRSLFRVRRRRFRRLRAGPFSAASDVLDSASPRASSRAASSRGNVSARGVSARGFSCRGSSRLWLLAPRLLMLRLLASRRQFDRLDRFRRGRGNWSWHFLSGRNRLGHRLRGRLRLGQPELFRQGGPAGRRTSRRRFRLRCRRHRLRAEGGATACSGSGGVGQDAGGLPASAGLGPSSGPFFGGTSAPKSAAKSPQWSALSWLVMFDKSLAEKRLKPPEWTVSLSGARIGQYRTFTPCWEAGARYHCPGYLPLSRCLGTLPPRCVIIMTHRIILITYSSPWATGPV